MLREIDAFDMSSIIDAIMDIVESQDPPFYINISGGTNMMAGAATAASFFVGAKGILRARKDRVKFGGFEGDRTSYPEHSLS